MLIIGMTRNKEPFEVKYATYKDTLHSIAKRARYRGLRERYRDLRCKDKRLLKHP